MWVIELLPNDFLCETKSRHHGVKLSSKQQLDNQLNPIEEDHRVSIIIESIGRVW